MTLDEHVCVEGERLNARIIKQGDEIDVDPEQVRAGCPYRVVDGVDKLEGEPPWEMKVEILRCADDHAEVRVLGESLRDLVK